MTKNPLRDILSRLLHDSAIRREDFEIVYVSRGAPNDLERVNGALLIKVGATYFIYQTAEGEIKSIPFHRVVLVRNIRNGYVAYHNPHALH